MATEHFIVRVGDEDLNWRQGMSSGIWALSSTHLKKDGTRRRAMNLKALRKAINQGTAMVWFVVNKGPRVRGRFPRGLRPAGRPSRIVAVCRPTGMRARNENDPSDHHIGWVNQGSNSVISRVTGRLIVQDYDVRMLLGSVTFPDSDNLDRELMIKYMEHNVRHKRLPQQAITNTARLEEFLDRKAFELRLL